MNEDDADALISIRRVSFLDTTDYEAPEQRERLLERMTKMVGGFVDGELVCAGAMQPFRMFVDGSPADVGGLASVVSAAEHRRKGYVREMLHGMLETLKENGVGWCLEYPFDPRFYARLGWQTIPNGVHVEAPPDRLRVPTGRSSGGLVDPGDDAARKRIAQIYEAWARRYNFTMTRDCHARDDWRRVLQGPPWRSPSKTRFVYLFDEAYCVVQLREEDDRQTAYVVDTAWESDTGRDEVFGLLANFDGQSDVVHIQLPVREPKLLDLTPFLVEQPHPLQARIVSVERALAGRPVRGNFDIVIAVEDDFCGWNDGQFRVRSGDGRSTVERTDDPPDLQIDVRRLALYTSDRPAAEYAAVAADEDRAAEVFRALGALAGRTTHMALADYF